MNEDERLRRRLRAVDPPPMLEARILEQLPPAPRCRAPIALALGLVPAVLLFLGWVWRPAPAGVDFVRHVRAEAALHGRIAPGPDGAELSKHCRVGGVRYHHVRLVTGGGAVDVFIPEGGGLPPVGAAGLDQGRAWRVLELEGRPLLAVYPPGVDPVPVLAAIHLG